MKKEEKINYLQENYYTEWIATRKSVEEELSERQRVFCICGCLATGLHENSCKRFQNNVNGETVRRLKHLIKK